MADQTDPETVESSVDHIDVIQHGDSYRQVHHVTGQDELAEAGFDLTTFGDSRTFEEMLADLDLLPEINYNEEYYMREEGWVPDPQYAKIDKSPDEPDREYGIYVWANQHLALITANNPITGEYSDPDMRGNEKGYASYIGLSGTSEAVREAYDAIAEEAEHIKGRNPIEREFV